VLLKATTARRYESGSARLQIGKETFSCRLNSDYDFGESECGVEVPELSGPTPARLAATLGKLSVASEVTLVPQRSGSSFSVRRCILIWATPITGPMLMEVHNRIIDQVIAMMEAHPDYKFNPDGSFIFEDYWKHRGEDWRERCLKVLREGGLGFLPSSLRSIPAGLSGRTSSLGLLQHALQP